jgi:hypothetical protein
VSALHIYVFCISSRFYGALKFQILALIRGTQCSKKKNLFLTHLSPFSHGPNRSEVAKSGSFARPGSARRVTLSLMRQLIINSSQLIVESGKSPAGKAESFRLWLSASHGHFFGRLGNHEMRRRYVMRQLHCTFHQDCFGSPFKILGDKEFH